MIGHNGGHAGTSTFVFMEPVTGLMSVSLTNVDHLQARGALGCSVAQ